MYIHIIINRSYANSCPRTQLLLGGLVGKTLPVSQSWWRKKYKENKKTIEFGIPSTSTSPHGKNLNKLTIKDPSHTTITHRHSRQRRQLLAISHRIESNGQPHPHCMVICFFLITPIVWSHYGPKYV